MTKEDLEPLRNVVIILVVASLVGMAGNTGSVRVGGWALFGLCGSFAFLVNWLAFIPAYLLRTEVFYDLTGSVAYLSVVTGVLAFGGPHDLRTLMIGCLVAIWAMRLGTFLFARVRAAEFDRRFTNLKATFPMFLMTWTLQGMWVFLSLAAGLAAMTSTNKVPLDAFAAIGAAMWVAGFAIEVVADDQKRRFRNNPDNNGKFIRTGLWAWSRHPNYFGEILLWAGITVIAIPVLSGWQWVTLISPLFVFVLLTRISGIPMLETRGKKVWGDDPEYQEYKARTPVLMMRPPAR